MNPRFYRGMLHSHTLWSDGRALPEQAVAAYRDAGYDCLSITDHNRYGADPDRWLPVAPDDGKWPPKVATPGMFAAYRAAFPDGKWRERSDGTTEVRLSTMAEVARRFNDPERFLVLPGWEDTSVVVGTDGASRDLHMNCIGIDELIPRLRSETRLIESFQGREMAGIVRETAREVAELAAAKGNPPHLFFLNHPQWRFLDVPPRVLTDNPEVRFFEVCNNGGDRDVPQPLMPDGFINDRFWDAVNAVRCARGEPLLYALGSDDTHWYPGAGTDHPGEFGDAWIGVRAGSLTAAALFAAMDRGDFYASCGVDFSDIRFDSPSGTLSVAAAAKPGVAHTVKFITTKRGVPAEPVRFIDIPPLEDGRLPRRVPQFDPRVGAVVKTVAFGGGEEVRASCAMASDDLYIRARVESNEPATCRTSAAGLHPPVKTAWTQPYRLD